MPFQNYKFLDDNNDDNNNERNNYNDYNYPDDNQFRNKYQLESFQNYNNFMDDNVKQYEASNSDFYKMENNLPINTNYSTNGRVLFDIKSPAKQFNLFEENKMTQGNVSSVLNYSQESTPLSNTFFSETNIDNLQQLIRLEIFKQCERDNDPILTNHKPIHISNQNTTSLKIIMRSIYLQYGKNLPTNINQQVNELNKMVLQECVTSIITNLKQYLGYINDIQRLPNPMNHPSNVSSKGEKTYSLLIV
jgi:hypothetical protein